MTVDEQIAAVTEDGKKSWLIVSGQRYDFDPPRNEKGWPLRLPGERKPMDRFAFQVDGFTTIDAEILPDDTLRIIHNGCREKHYPEDAAFLGDEFTPGQVVTWLAFRKALRRWVELSNQRVNREYETEWETEIGGE